MYLDDKALPEAVPVKELAAWQLLCLKAADYLEEKGWCQRSFYVGERVCLLGALGKAESGRAGTFGPNAEFAVQHLSEKLVAQGYPSWSKFSVIHRWNDMQSRNKKQVIDLLRSMAK